MKSKNYLNAALICLFLSVFLFACEDEPLPDDDGFQAEKISIETLRKAYDWFPEKFDSYKADTGVVNQIKNAFIKGQHKVLIYFKPSCACRGTQEIMPYSLRTLSDAGFSIDTNNFAVYSMFSPAHSFPEKDLFRITELPMVMVIKNNVAVYSTVDTLIKEEKAYNDAHPELPNDSTFQIERYILRGLLK